MSLFDNIGFFKHDVISMLKIASLHMNAVNSFLDGCRRRGVDPKDIVASIGMNPAILEQQESRFPAEKAGELLTAISRTLNDETLGFFQRSTLPGGIEMSLHVAIHASDIEEAINRWGRYWCLLHDECRFKLHYENKPGEDELAIINIDFTDRYLLQCASFITWFVFFFVRWASWMMDKSLLLERLDLPFPFSHVAEDYPDMFPSQFYFDQPCIRLVFARRFLTLPIVKKPKDIPEFAAVIPNLMTTHRVDRSYTGRIRRLLRQSDNVDALPLKAIADEFSLTPETLRRRLKNEGSSYASIKEAVRRDLAVYQLCQTDLAINQIAINTGFSEPSAFNRAFKRWTGQTPGDYRKG
jgi:AraC-like DNA-binding protein